MLVVQRHRCANGMIVGEATLSAEKSLNALDGEMARELLAVVDEWCGDDSVAAAVINGAGARAFCAGGDVRKVYAAANNGDMKSVGAYFADEYRADFALHCFNKPLVCWAGGFVMGGGAGIMQGCNLRVATDTTMFAMPETAIGAAPDVGAAFFLREVKGAFFLGLSGAPIRGAEVKALGLADYNVNNDCRAQLMERLCAVNWQRDSEANTALARQCLGELQTANPPANKPAPMLQAQQQIAGVDSPEAALALNNGGNDFLQFAAKRLRAASPAAMMFWRRHFQSLQHSSLAEVFAADYRAMTGMAALGDFCEGVRALLMDKDNAPKWKYNSPAEVPEEWLQAVAEHDGDGAKKLLNELNERARKHSAV